MRLFWADADYRAIAEIPASTATLTLHHNAAGGVLITAPSVPDGARAVIGVADSGEEIWRGEIRGVIGDDDADDRVIFGVDMLGMVGGYSAWPSIDGDFTAAEYDTYTGAASSAIYHYMRNLTDASAPAWRRKNITLDTDTGIGETVKTSARFDNLLTLLNEIATLGGVRFRFVGSLFTVDTGADRTDVLFAKHAGTATVKWRKQAPAASVITAGGAGEGTARAFEVVYSPADLAAWGVIEQFYDVRNATASDLATIARQKLGAGESGYAAIITPTGAVDATLLPGDTVLVWADGAAREMVIQSIRYTLDGWTLDAAERAAIPPVSVGDLGIDGLKRSVELLQTK